MPKHQKGDIVHVDGNNWTIASWPADDEGPFFAIRNDDQGNQYQSVMYAGQVNDEVEQSAPAVDVGESVGQVAFPNSADAPPEPDPETAVVE